MTAQTLSTVDWGKVGLWGPPVPRRRWGPRDAGYAVLWLLVANVALAVPVVAWMSTTSSTTDPATITGHPAVLTAGLLVLWAVFAGVPAAVSRRHGAASLAKDFGWVTPTRADWAFAVKLGLVMRGADIGLGVVAAELGWATGDNSNWLFDGGRTWVLTAFFVLGAAVIAPALEELFFRGLVMGAIRRAPRLAGAAKTWVPVAVSSVIFGVLHANALDLSGAYVVALTAACGAVLAVVAVRHGNLGASVATHIVFNSTGVIGAWLMAA